MAEKPNVLGKRILCDGFYGTVRYYGQVSTTTGEWYGIEWDDTQRGKHDGSVEGVKYFDCRHPTGGSFVRPKKVSFGVSVIKALQKRYGDEDTSDQDMYVQGTRNKKVVVEMVGAESVQKKQSCFEKLQDVVLRGGSVNGPEKGASMHEIVPYIRELDLSLNLLSTWNNVAEITKNMRHLKTLIVSENMLILPKEPDALMPSFTTVKELYLNKMNLEWCQVIDIVQMFPSLEDLHLRKNNIKSLKMDGNDEILIKRLQNIKNINLDNNQLTDWSDILLLGRLPKLNGLILNENKISEVYFDKPDSGNVYSKAMVFKSLSSLHLYSTNINHISSINALNRLQSLVKLQFQNSPLFKDETSFTSRQELIARIRSLQIVNNSPIDEKERVAAERAYIKKYARDWTNAGGNSTNIDSNNLSPEFVTNHPRYTELIKVHGPPEDDLQKGSQTLKDSLITITIKCPDDPNKKTLSKKLPGTMTIGKFKGLLYRMYKVDSSDQQLSYLDTKNDREIPLDDDLRQINFYSVVSGDTVFLRW